MIIFRATDARDAALDLSDLFNVSLQEDDLQDFDTRWDQTLFSASKRQEANVLETLYKFKIRDTVQLQTVLAMYDQGIVRD